MADPLDPGAPLWWVKRLYREMVLRRPLITKASDYYDGHHNLEFQSKRFIEAFGGLFDSFADNWCEVVVDAAEERLNPTGIRVGEQPQGDKDAWRLWQANDMDGQAQLAHTDALVCGESYAVVWLSDDPNTPEICVEHPSNCIVEHHPKHRRLRRAGLRVWRDEWGYDHAELFLPDAVYLFRSAATQEGGMVDAETVSWIADDKVDLKLDVNGAMPNPLGVVPVVALPNRPRSINARHGIIAHSEIRSIIPLQDAVNKMLADMLVGSEAAALPKRYAAGLKLDRDSENRPIDPKLDKASALISEDPNARFGNFQAADLNNFVVAVDMLVQHLASISRTPPHYLNASADRLSGESIKAAETGLVAKVRRKMIPFGEGWETVMRLAGQLAGIDHLANAEQMEVIWADPESRTEAQHVDAVMKQKELGVPEEILWEKLGYSPTEIARIKALKAEEALFGPVPDELVEPEVPVEQ